MVDREVATSVVELKDRVLHVNGEPFLVKGMVATFSTPAIELPLAEGYRQLKRLGVNAIRLYHPPTPAILAALRDEELMVIAQPEQSTWNAFDPSSALDRRFYQRRWEELVGELDGFPYALLLNVGNELEINDRSPETLGHVAELIETANATPRMLPTSYSTFVTFVSYPADILGVNMLDTGSTYWQDTVANLPLLGRPFYASELGGFVAFYEYPPVWLRRRRLQTQWQTLLQSGANGAVFYVSHDNWAQAVPPGFYNDPLTAELPDDRRGFWDHENHPKPELDTLEALLADVELEPAVGRVEGGDLLMPVRAHNRRPYALRGLVANLAGRPWPLGDLSPGETRQVELPLVALRHLPSYPLARIELTYTTHAGLEGQSISRLSVPDPSDGPVPLGAGFQVTLRSPDRVDGVLLSGEAMDLEVPATWRGLEVNGVAAQAEGGRARVPMHAPLHEVSDLESSLDGRNFSPWSPSIRQQPGLVFLRFRLPEVTGAPRLLLLQGLGASQVHLRWDDGTTASYPAHPYRETVVELGARSGQVTLKVERRSLEYLRRGDSPSGEPILIGLGEPVVFCPRSVEVRQHL
ncbi:MAG: glycoside hydrolase family protein [Myxococcaceae bacterium]